VIHRSFYGVHLMGTTVRVRYYPTWQCAKKLQFYNSVPGAERANQICAWRVLKTITIRYRERIESTIRLHRIYNSVPGADRIYDTGSGAGQSNLRLARA
jgi:hypothetical protein